VDNKHAGRAYERRREEWLPGPRGNLAMLRSGGAAGLRWREPRSARSPRQNLDALPSSILNKVELERYDEYACFRIITVHLDRQLHPIRRFSMARRQWIGRAEGNVLGRGYDHHSRRGFDAVLPSSIAS